MNNIKDWVWHNSNRAGAIGVNKEVIYQDAFYALLENYTLVSNHDIADLEQAAKKLPTAGGQREVDEARIDLVITLNNIKNSGKF